MGYEPFQDFWMQNGKKGGCKTMSYRFNGFV